MLRKRIALLIVIAMFATLFPFGVAADGEKPSSWAEAAVREAIAIGIVPERLQSDYQSPITREEFAELVVNTVFEKVKREAFGSPMYWTPELLLERVTLDVEFEDAKQDHVKLAFMLGTINGVSDTHFAPDRHITRQEAAAMLVNTVHYGNVISYSTGAEMGYADWDMVAEWAKPAVSAAKNMAGLMEGVGGKFDPHGSFTREQSIATMMRLLDKYYHRVILKGNLPLYENFDELNYSVGKDYVKVRYQRDEENYPYTDTEYKLKGNWERYEITKAHLSKFSSEKAIIIFSAIDVIKPTVYTQIVAPTLDGRQVKLDYGYMTVTTFNEDSLLEFRYKNISGFMNGVAGYTYGYPKVRVEVNVIE